jgi:DNA-binding beta-propeller fold protein YncE
MNIVDPRRLALAAAGLLAGCATIQNVGSGPAFVPSADDQMHKPASLLYLAQCCVQLFSNRGDIMLYDLGLTGVARTITRGVSNPSSITVDRAGRIYMVSALDSLQGITEYDAGSERPSRRVKLPYAWAPATDRSNNLYAAACRSCHEYVRGKGSVNVYQAGTTKLLRSIEDGIHAPSAVALDTDGDVYVLDHTRSRNSVIVYAPGANKPLRNLQQGLTDPFAIALDPSNNLLVLRNGYTSSPSIVEYTAGSNKILRTITKGLSSPQAMTLDSSGTLYVSNTPFPSQGWVSVYAPGALIPRYRITSGMNDPQLLRLTTTGCSTSVTTIMVTAEACAPISRKPRNLCAAF